MQFSDAIWWRHNKSKMADGLHIENGFLAISRRHIGRSTRNLEHRWWMTCRYMTRDQNCNFRKFKMADGRPFENSIISISQPRINRSRSNSVGWCRFQFQWWPFNKTSTFCKFKMAYWNSFLAIYRTRDQNYNFPKCMMADGRHFENSFISIS